VSHKEAISLLSSTHCSQLTFLQLVYLKILCIWTILKSISFNLQYREKYYNFLSVMDLTIPLDNTLDYTSRWPRNLNWPDYMLKGLYVSVSDEISVISSCLNEAQVPYKPLKLSSVADISMVGLECLVTSSVAQP